MHVNHIFQQHVGEKLILHMDLLGGMQVKMKKNSKTQK